MQGDKNLELRVEGEVFVLEFNTEVGEWNITSGQTNASRVMN